MVAFPTTKSGTGTSSSNKGVFKYLPHISDSLIDKTLQRAEACYRLHVINLPRDNVTCDVCYCYFMWHLLKQKWEAKLLRVLWPIQCCECGKIMPRLKRKLRLGAHHYGEDTLLFPPLRHCLDF